MSRIYALHPVMHLNENEALSFTKEDGALTLPPMPSSPAPKTMSSSPSVQRVHTIALPLPPAMYPGIAATQIDTIGAGDSHIGAVIACEQLGRSLPESIRIANRIAAKVVETSEPS